MEEATRKKLTTRLRRIQGQIGALERMVADDLPCVDILLQISAARGGLDKVGHLLLGFHVEHCLTDACRNGDDEARQHLVNELMDVLGRYGGVAR